MISAVTSRHCAGPLWSVGSVSAWPSPGDRRVDTSNLPRASQESRSQRTDVQQTPCSAERRSHPESRRYDAPTQDGQADAGSGAQRPWRTPKRHRSQMVSITCGAWVGLAPVWWRGPGLVPVFVFGIVARYLVAIVRVPMFQQPGSIPLASNVRAFVGVSSVFTRSVMDPVACRTPPTSCPVRLSITNPPCVQVMVPSPVATPPSQAPLQVKSFPAPRLE